MHKNIKIALVILVLLATAGYLLFQLYASGLRLYTKWEPIGSPPDKIEELIGIEIGSPEGRRIYNGRETKIYALTSTGKIYSCCGAQDTVWRVVATNKSNEYIFADCSSFGIPYYFILSNETFRRTAIWCSEFDRGKVTYILHSDGTVSYHKEFSSLFLFVFSLYFFVPQGIGVLLILIFLIDKSIIFIRKKFIK